MAALQIQDGMSGASLGLTYGFADVLVTTIGGRSVLYALSRTEATIVEVSLGSDGSLTLLNGKDLSGTFAAGGDPALGIVDAVGPGGLLLLAGMNSTSGQCVTLGPLGTLGEQTACASNSAFAAPVGLDLDGTPALVVGRTGAGGLDLFVAAGDGFVWMGSVEDAEDRALADVAAAVTVEHDGFTLVATVSGTENGMNLVSAGADGLTQIAAMGSAEGLAVGRPSDIEAIQRLDETLLIVSGHTSSSLSVVSLGPGGAPILADHILDTPWTKLRGAEAVATATFGDFAFVAAGGSEGGVSLFTVLPGGRLVHLSSVADRDSVPLYRISSLEAQVADSRLDVLAVSSLEAGIARLSYDLSSMGSVVFSSGGEATGTTKDDQVIGSATADSLAGGVGDDIIFDGAGEDFLGGGVGADLFVLHNDRQSDTILDFERGIDRLDLSSWDMLHSASQLSVTPTSDGAILAFGAETIVLHLADGLPFGAAELSDADVLNVDRPSFLAVGQWLAGGELDDILNGGAGPDTILGADGDDSLWGYLGDDALTGGAGCDTLDGGSGKDTLSGQGEDDLLVGGADDDLIVGDEGNDVIFGDQIL